MKKIYSILLGIALITMATAGLVTYLSNTTQVDVSVESPIYQVVSLDGDTWTEGPLSFNTVGGNTINFLAKDTNLADVEIETTSENIVTNPNGVTCNDFVSVIATTTTTIGEGEPEISGPHDLIDYGLCSQVNANEVTFSYGPSPNTWEVGKEDVSEISITFQPNAKGVYTYQNTNLYPN